MSKLYEAWQFIPGWARRYSASTLGKIRREATVTSRDQRIKSKIMEPQIHRGRRIVKLGSGRDARRRYVAALVLAAFGRPRPTKNAGVVFKNGSREDCRLSNLEWTPTSRRPEEVDS